MEQTTNTTRPAAKEESLTFNDYVKQCVHRWKWILLSLLFFSGLGMLYIVRQQPVYKRSMQVLIKDEDSNDPMSSMSSSFSDFGFGSAKANVYNEMITFRSPAVMYDVVNRLHLDVNYTQKGKFPMHGTTLYGENQPFSIRMEDVGEQEAAGFRIECLPNGDLKLFKFIRYEESGKKTFDKEIKGKVDGPAVRTPIGRIAITSNPNYKRPVKKTDGNPVILIFKMALQDAVEYYQSKLNVDLVDTDADVIDLSIKDTSVERACDVLSTLLEVYNQNWIKDKNTLAEATSAFIDERLKIIESELGSVDSDISAYKSKHLMPDIEMSAKVSLEYNERLSLEMLKLTTERSMTTYVRDYVLNPANVNKVIPQNSGIGSNQLELQIGNYNTLLLQRNNIAENSSENNPLVLDYDAQLKGMREAIARGISSYAASLDGAIKDVGRQQAKAEGQLSSGPAQAKYLLSVERQQKVKESLYLFLLERREENELNQAFTAYNSRVITPPSGGLRAIAPQKPLIMGSMIGIGLIIPLLWIYFSLVVDNKVRSRRDLERMSTPFAGEIPMISRKSRKGLRDGKAGKLSKNGKQLENVVLAVRAGSRDVASEAFRIVRGSVDFMVKNQKTNIIMLTSFNPGSGKSFVGFNLAASFALKDKKVLIIDGDLRHGSVSQFVNMPSKGISNYLTGATDDWKKYLIQPEQTPGVFVLPIGHRPPNPAELLDNGRIKTLFDEAREEFDYVFIDCPPVDIVVDTQILEKYVDRTLFVIRAGLLDKRAIVEIDEIYKSKRFRNMSIILNGVESVNSRSHSYGSYGYYGAD